jgi:hypothetical protein
MTRVKPMRYHGPGWEAEVNDIDYQVWAPREAEPNVSDGTDFGPKHRADWQSAWTGDGGDSGDVRHGDTLDEVLGIFPASVAVAFRREIDAWLAEPSTTTWKLGAL